MTGELILPNSSATKIVYLSTDNTGEGITIAGPEGTLQCSTVYPHGVVLEFAGKQLSIHRELLPVFARYFGAAACKLGVDVNDGWDREQHAVR